MYQPESDLLVASLFRNTLSVLIVQMNDQPEHKDTHTDSTIHNCPLLSQAVYMKTLFNIVVLFSRIEPSLEKHSFLTLNTTIM